MNLPTEEQIAKVGDDVAALTYAWARRIEALATKYKLRGESMFSASSYPNGRFVVGCENTNLGRTWGVFFFCPEAAPRPVEECRLTVKLDFVEAAPFVEEEYLKEVEKFYERAQKVLASDKETKEPS